MGNEYLPVLVVITVAIAIDLIIGEVPTAIHPVVCMGKVVEKLKPVLLSSSSNRNRMMGFIMTLLLIFIFVCGFDLILLIFSFNNILFMLIAFLLLSTTFSIRSLIISARNVGKSLDDSLNEGRRSISLLVSRNTSNLSSPEVVSATIETLTENITDSVIAPIFYIFSMVIVCFFLVLYCQMSLNGHNSSFYQLIIILLLSAGFFYRVVNTLDAMVGYQDPENIDLGWFPAKLDDCLNYIPARVTGFLLVTSSYIIGLDYQQAWKIMRRDARNTPSPNSGYSMAAAAGALNVQLVKPGIYILGDSGLPLNNQKIGEAIKLSKVTISLFLMIILLILVIIIFYALP